MLCRFEFLILDYKVFFLIEYLKINNFEIKITVKFLVKIINFLIKIKGDKDMIYVFCCYS